MSSSDVKPGDESTTADYVPDYVPPLEYAVVRDPPLDSALANMDEEFNSAFDKRMSRVVDLPELQFVQAGDDLYKTLKIFRRVAQMMGEEWRPVFKDLMKKQKPELVEAELKQVELHKPLIQGYRALMVWREISGSLFHITKLIDSLRSSNMPDIALEVLDMLKDEKPVATVTRSSTRRKKIDVSTIENDPLNNKVLLQLAKKIPKEWTKLGKALGMEDSELEDIKGYVGAEHERFFKVLWSWKESKKSSPDCKESLRKAFSQIGFQDVFDECFGTQT